jgi:zinc protease
LKIALLASLAVGLALAASARAAHAGAVVPYPITEHNLPNGLRVVFVKTPHEGVAAYYTLVRTGSRNEIEPGHSGFAHLFEHMMFRGTKKYSSEQRDAELMKMGVTDNAFTSDDVTVYTNYGPSAGLAKLIEIEADRFQNLDYTEPAFQTETKAVLGEYNKNFSDPAQKMDELLSDLAFTTHTYKHTTMGFLEDIKAMPTRYEYSKSFFKRWYRPDNCVIFVVGGFDPEATLALIEEHYGSWGGTTAQIEIPVEPPQTGEKRLHHDWDTPTQPRAMVAYKTPGASSGLKDCAVQNVLNMYLIGDTSPAYKSLVLERQIVERIEPWYFDHRDPRLWTYNLVLKDAAHTSEALAFIDQSVADLASGKIDEKRFRDAQSNFRYGLSMQMETPAEIAVNLAVMSGLTGDVNTLDRLAEAVAALAPGDLVAFASKHLTPSNRTVVTLATREEETHGSR